VSYDVRALLECASMGMGSVQHEMTTESESDNAGVRVTGLAGLQNALICAAVWHCLAIHMYSGKAHMMTIGYTSTRDSSTRCSALQRAHTGSDSVLHLVDATRKN
jgi:hypothetical protein